jgi:hypothetical protein
MGGLGRLALRLLDLVEAPPLQAGRRDEADAFEHPVELHVQRLGERDPFDAPHFLLPEEDGDEPHRVDPGPLGEIADGEAELLHATAELAALEGQQLARPLVDAVPPELRGCLLVAAELADRGEVGVAPPTFLSAGTARRPRHRLFEELDPCGRREVAYLQPFDDRAGGDQFPCTPLGDPPLLGVLDPAVEVFPEIFEKPGALRGIQARRIAHPVEQPERDPLGQAPPQLGEPHARPPPIEPHHRSASLGPRA